MWKKLQFKKSDVLFISSHFSPLSEDNKIVLLVLSDFKTGTSVNLLRCLTKADK